MENEEILDAGFYSDGKERVEVKLMNKYYFIILSLLSFGLYEIWWQYKTWIFFKERQKLDIMPAPRALFSILFIFSLFEKILVFGKRNGVSKEYSSSGLFALYFFLNFIINRLPDPLFLFSFFSVFVFLEPLNVFNQSLQNSDDFDAYYADGFSQRQMVLIAVGVIFWLLFIIGTFSEIQEF